MPRISKIIVILCLPFILKAEFVVKSLQELRNQSVVRQSYEESCGASSLATLINLIDNQKLSELNLLKTMSEKELFTDMISFADLEEAVKKKGFRANSFRIDRQSLDKLLNIPLLVKIEDDPRFPHFVVIINHEGSFMQIYDPNYGEYISSKREFYSVWDKKDKGGYVLIVLPKKALKEFKLNLPKALHFERQLFKQF